MTHSYMHYPPLFNGMPVQEKYLPMVTGNLESLQNTLENAVNDYCRVVAIRFDPIILNVINDQMTVDDHKILIQRFHASLKSIIKHDLKRRRKSNWVPDTKVRTVWAREVGKNGRLHYHFLLILNRDAYHLPGRACSPNENLCNRISRAWYSALGVEWNPYDSWIHMPQYPTYWIDRGDAYRFGRAFRRASYLCKAETKQYGLGVRTFGTSRN